MRLRQEIRETYLSTNWLEYHEDDKLACLRSIVAIHRAKAKGRLSPNSGVAVLKAEQIRDIGSAHDRKLSVRHTPTKNDPSYSRVSGLPLDNSNELLLAALAEEAYRDFTLIRNIDASITQPARPDEPSQS